MVCLLDICNSHHKLDSNQTLSKVMVEKVAEELRKKLREVLNEVSEKYPNYTIEIDAKVSRLPDSILN